jgi:hypothetical protein
MATINPHLHLQAVRTWLVDALNASAAWRELKAQDYPDDTRNHRAAAALRSAANHVQWTANSPGVERFVELDNACADSGMVLMVDGSLPGQESQRVATRYFFDNLPGNADLHTNERLMLDLYEASLLDLREWSLSSDSPLGRLLLEGRPEVDSPDGDTAERYDGRTRVEQLLNVAAKLDRLAEIAMQEADAEGRLAGPRVPLARKQLQVSLTALRALGGPELDPVWKLIAEPPQFLTATRSAVHDALDAVNSELEGGV